MEEEIKPVESAAIPEAPVQPQPVPVLPPKRSKLPLIAILLVAILLIAVGGIYAKKFLNKSEACTLDAQVCPDGSTVGRTGPNCEFAPCPTRVSSATPTPDETANWKVCVNSKDGFSIAYPTGFDIDPTTCNYAVMDYNLVKDINVSDPFGDFRKSWLLTITAEKTSLDIIQWIKNKCPVGSPGCSESIPGPIANSEQYDLLNVHYAETDTVVKINDTIFNFSLNARNPSTPVKQDIRRVYNQILSTFKFTETANWKTYTNSSLTFKYPSTWKISNVPNRIEGTSPLIVIDVIDKDSTLMNECMRITSTNVGDGVSVKKFSRVTTGEMCSTNDGTPREIWVIPNQNAYAPGISFRYSVTDEIAATKLFDQILSTFRFD